MKYRESKRLDQKAKDFGEYIVKYKATLRKTAEFFCVSKSSVHILVTTRLREADYVLYKEVMKIISKNKAERYSRGGIATKKKHEELRKRL